MKEGLQNGGLEGVRPFPPTRWSLVRQLNCESPVERDAAHRALAELCRIYWLPLYGFARRSGFSASDAEDLVQDFFASLLRREALRQVERGKGKLRSFLLASLKNHLRESLRRTSRRKRGGGATVVSIDVTVGERSLCELADEALHPDEAFDRTWVTVLLDEVLRDFAAECGQTGHTELFQWVAPHLNPSADDRVPYEEMADTFGMTEGAARVMMHRLRKRYRRLLRQRIADTLDSQDSLEDEVNYLIGLFGRASPDQCNAPPQTA